MSKTKTKRARRELKREGDRKIAAHHKKLAKAAIETNKSAATKQPAKKKQQQQKPSTTTPATPTTTVTTTSASTPAAPVQASQNHAIPFGAYSHILLVGEGDFSFARSLAIDHGCANVVGTSYDTEAEVREKYPTFADVEAELEGLAPPVPLYHGIDATRLSSYKQLRCRREDGDDDELDEDREGEEEGPSGEGWDTIAFMFPHTGGLSTDVNRQVRVNQALLVGFFKACLDTSTAKRRLAILEAQKNKVAPPSKPFLRMGGRIIVTLFEGEPYTLWNVRDLARHAGLKVIESWKFDWSQYPGYSHVRTLGAIEGGGAWRGEDRQARMYVFEKIPLVADSDDEAELAKQARMVRGGRLPSQKAAMKRAFEEEGE